jgi:hypothetical protein
MFTHASKTITAFGITLALAALLFGSAWAQDGSLAARDPKLFKICQNQTYALCALAECFVMDGVSYCKCDVKTGDSISLPFKYDGDQDACSTNAQGAANGYMVSTFSYPEQVSAPNGDKALYDCPASTAPYGASAQCDGGICFKGTQGTSFPGFNAPLTKDQIICSCPIAVTNPASAKTGFQIAGPYPCQDSFFKNCASPNAKPKTGSSLYVGAPTGSAVFLTRVLTGKIPKVNRCMAPGGVPGQD